MLLTLPWLGSIILGRVDIVNKQGKDGVTSKFTVNSFVKQGVSVFPDVTNSAIIMLVSALPYFIVQGADWHWGPRVKKEAQQPEYIRKSALATAILAFILFISYLVLQVFYSVQSRRRDEQRRLEMYDSTCVLSLSLVVYKYNYYTDGHVT
ncbi:hypothetical protein GBAR_LOCUS764 [Geodia barretti]|uniref:Uncharacterized protein n=1 Tax=Geodia barretti TaxID=519541 RepID=A0AA35VTH1_GEOBA|nr:hypothetical protein GBAR_LOCUS764 [Geodia barretti]